MTSAGFEGSDGLPPATGVLWFIINPTAGNGRAAKVWQELKTYLDAERIPYLFAFSRHAEDVEQLARRAATVSGAVVAGVGGDGTLSRIAQSLAGSEAVLGIIPAGTGNDFARNFRIPTDPLRAAHVLVHGKTVLLDAGRLNGRMFLNIVGAGLDAAVVADANRVFKKFTGKMGYLLALLKQLLLYHPAALEIDVDGVTSRTRAWLVAVANARYYGSGMNVAPGADPQDGKADIVIVENIHRLQFLRLFPLVYSGRHAVHPAVRILRGKTIRISSETELFIHADGDLQGKTPLVVTMEKHAVRLRVPAAEE